MDVAAARECIRQGADVNVQGEYALTALHVLSAVDGYEELIQELIEAGGDVNARDSVGQTPLHDAVRGGGPKWRVTRQQVRFRSANDTRSVKTVKLLLKAGADVNATSSFNDSVVDYAEDALRKHELGSGSLSREAAVAREIGEA